MKEIQNKKKTNTFAVQQTPQIGEHVTFVVEQN